MRERATRCDVQVRDIGNHTSPNARVEMTFLLGDQLYAIEHAGIEPFDGFMKHKNRASALFVPLETEITGALRTLLTPGVVIEMHMPIDAFNSRESPSTRVCTKTPGAAWNFLLDFDAASNRYTPSRPAGCLTSRLQA
jgi:hypothetical protein